jgi:hypothetical protein
MAKTIIFQNIKIKELALSKDEKGKIHIAVVYSTLDDKGQEFNLKRTDLQDVSLTAKQMENVQAVFDLVATTLKQVEGI